MRSAHELRMRYRANCPRSVVALKSPISLRPRRTNHRKIAPSLPLGRWYTTAMGVYTQGPNAVTRSAKRESSPPRRSEEHTSELQSRLHLVCRLLLEKK